jgi:hypothetical protein
MACLIVFNEFEPNKYADNAHLLMVLFCCFAFLISRVSDIYVKKMKAAMEKISEERFNKVRNKSFYYYSFIFGNCALCFVLGFWLRGIFLLVGCLAFASANNEGFSYFKKPSNT